MPGTVFSTGPTSVMLANFAAPPTLLFAKALEPM